MPGTQLYLHRGNFHDCLCALIARSGSFGGRMLSLVSNDRSGYYGMVDDSFLASDCQRPEDNTMRLVLRVTDSELQQIYSTFESLQPDLFK